MIRNIIPILSLLALCVATSPQASSQDILHKYEGDSLSELFGISVDSAGDVDGDGLTDQVVGAPRDPESGAFAGSTSLYQGGDGALRYKWLGQAGDSLGHCVAYAGDIDSDGYCDVALAVPGHQEAGFGQGTIRVVSGFSGTLIIEIYAVPGAQDFFPHSISYVGDVNGDGVGDIAATTPAKNEVYIFSGFDGSQLALASDPLTCPGSFSGKVGGLGDVNGDLIPDLAVATCDLGGARVISGADGSDIYYVPGGADTGIEGVPLAVLGDVDGDQIQDFLTSSILDDTFGPNTGIARVFSGATGALIHTVYGKEPGARFGAALGGLGDLDGDGVLDFMVGANLSKEDLAPGSGRVFFHSGKDASLLLTLAGAPGTLFGSSIASAGDVNGDSLIDVIIGAANEGPLVSGAAYVYSGKCGNITEYGPGCPGAGGFTPKLTTFAGCANVGQSLTLNMTEGLGGSIALLLIGGGTGEIPIGGGCSVLLSSIYPAIIPIPLGGAGLGSGSFTLFATTPPNAAGQTFAVQALVQDPSLTSGFSASNGLLLEVK